MARSYQVSVGGVTVVTLAGPTQAGGPYVWVRNPTGAVATVYIGGEDNARVQALTTSTGYEIPAGSSVGPIHLSGNEQIVGLSASNTTTLTIHVFRSSGVK